MTETKVFDRETLLPDERLKRTEGTLIGFEQRYTRIRGQLNLMLSMDEIGAWNRAHHGGRLHLCDLISEQYPLAIFYGDVGTGKSVTAECMANRLVAESGVEDSLLFKLSTRVRGSGKVGEIGTLLSQAFSTVTQSAGRQTRFWTTYSHCRKHRRQSDDREPRTRGAGPRARRRPGARIGRQRSDFCRSD